MSDEDTMIPLKKSTRAKLKKLSIKKETYDQTIQRFLPDKPEDCIQRMAKVCVAYYAPLGEGDVEEFNDLESAFRRIRKLFASGKVFRISIDDCSGEYRFEGDLEVE